MFGEGYTYLSHIEMKAINEILTKNSGTNYSESTFLTLLLFY